MTGNDEALDLRQLALDQGVRAAVDKLDALVPGEGVVLITGSDPGPPVLEILARRPGASDIGAVEATEYGFRIEIRRRASHEPVALDDLLHSDHALLHDLLAFVEALSAKGRPGALASPLAALDRGLRRHILFEESLLFPALERQGSRRLPTSALRAQHREIAEALTSASRPVQRRDGAQFQSVAGELKDLLLGHHDEEEEVLYPATNVCASEDPSRGSCSPPRRDSTSRPSDPWARTPHLV